MVKFKLVSDLHLSETSSCHWRDLFSEDECEYLILAGDTARMENMNNILVPFIESICVESSFKKVFFLCGNHEYYNNAGYTFDGLLATFKDATRHLQNFTVLYNQSVDIGDNLRLFGGTMWSFIPTGSESIINHPIYDEKRQPITSNWYNCEHFAFLKNLDFEIHKAQQDKKRLLVASHHAPTFDRTLKSRHYTSPYRFIYCSDLDRYLSKSKVYTWMYGHTHVNADYLTVGDTRIVSNQYAADGYKPEKVISVSDTFKCYI